MSIKNIIFINTDMVIQFKAEYYEISKVYIDVSSEDLLVMKFEKLIVD